MGGGKPKTSAELEAELKKVLEENLLCYIWFVIGGMLIFLGVHRLVMNYDLFRIMPENIVILVFAPFVVWCLADVLPSLFLNSMALYELNMGQRDKVLKWFRWEIVAALLVLQPRAHVLIKALLKRVEVEEEEERSAV